MKLCLFNKKIKANKSNSSLYLQIKTLQMYTIYDDDEDDNDDDDDDDDYMY